MTSIEEIKLHLAASLAEAEQATLGISGVVHRLDQAAARLRLVTLGSVDPRVAEAIGRLEQAKAQLEQAAALVRSAGDAAGRYRALL